MKAISVLLLTSFLFTACQPNAEMTFDEKAALDQEIAETTQDLYEAQDKADQEKFAQMEPTDEDGDGYKTFTEDEYGISFDFPGDWDFELSRYGDGYRVDLSNVERTDGCEEGEAGVIFTFPNTKDASVSFDTFIHSSEIYDQGGGLGSLGGALTATTLAGRTAFHAESSGYETMCGEDDAYVVEMDESSYLFIGVFGNMNNEEEEEIQKILDSLLLQ